MTDQQQQKTINLRKELEFYHNRPVYKNPKTGKYYTFEKDEQTGESQLFTVFVSDDVYNNAAMSADKSGRAYKTISCKLKKTKNGYLVFTA